MAELYVVSLHISGLNVGVEVEHEYVLTRAVRLGRKERSKIQALKVKFYRTLERNAAFKLFDQYVVPETRLAQIEQVYREIRAEFERLREQVFMRLVADWPRIQAEIAQYFAKAGLGTPDLARLTPPSKPEELMEMGYTVTLLTELLRGYGKTIEALGKAGLVDVARRVAGEERKVEEELRRQYDQKVSELQETDKKLQEALKKKSVEAERLRLKHRELQEDIESLGKLLKYIELNTRLQNLYIKLLSLNFEDDSGQT